MLRAHKGEIPFLYCLLPFAAGIWVEIYSSFTAIYGFVMVLFLLSGVLLTALNLLYNRLSLHRLAWLGGVLIYAVMLSAGWLCSYMHKELNNASHFSKQKAQYLIVQIDNEPVQKGIYTRFTAHVLKTATAKHIEEANGQLLITLVTDSNSHLVNYGDQLLIPANYKPTDPPFNPAEFNYKKYLARQNIYHQSFITRYQFKLLQQHTGNSVIAFSLKLRQQLFQKIQRYFNDIEAAAVASTLLLGYKADLSDEILQAYSKTGTIHVLSVSGAHVAVFFGLIAFVFRPFKHYKYGKLFNAILSISLIGCYALLTGLSPAVCRAALMLSLIIVGKAGSRHIHPLNALAVSALILLLYNPFLLTDVGFQLSYLAVFGLIVLQPCIYEQLTFKHSWNSKLWYWCSSSLAAQLITFPLSAYYFHQFPVYFLISNVLILFPAELLVLGGLTFLLFASLPGMGTLSTGLGYLLTYLVIGINKTLAAVEHWPYASIGPIWFSMGQHLLIYAIMVAILFWLVTKRPKLLLIGIAGCFVLCVSLSSKTINAANRYQIVFFNVKKNSAILFKNALQNVLVTDLKKTDKTFKYSIQPCLDSLGIKQLNICHPQQDMMLPYFKKRHNYIRFAEKSVVLFNPLLQNAVLSQRMPTDYVLITGNPHTSLQLIAKSFKAKEIIVDANNSTPRIQRLKEEADSMRLKIFFLKRNNSFIVASKY